MSLTFGAFVSGGALLHNLDDLFQEYHQAAIKEAAMAGEAYLLDESDDATHTPIDTGDLISTVQIPIENQRSVTFKIAGVLVDPKSGRPGRPYGWAQELGWHDREGAFHEGHHMVENAALAAKATYVAFMTKPGAVRASVNGIRSSDVAGAGVQGVSGG